MKMVPDVNAWCGLEGPLAALVVGARGGIGAAFIDRLSQSNAVTKVFALSRDQEWVSRGPDSSKVERVYADITDEDLLISVSNRI